MKTTSKVFLAGATAVAMSAATLPAFAAESAPATVGVAIPAPVFVNDVDIEGLAGSTVHITTESPLVLNVDNPEAWTAAGVTDAEVAAFFPGHNDGSATFNPGFDGLKPGSTSASVLNPETGELITFTIVVDK